MHEAPASTLLAVLGDAMRSTLEMKMKDWKPRSDWGKRFLAEVKADAKGEGEAKGRAESRVEDILDLLEVRGLALEPPLRDRLTACTDLDVLTRWFRRAATATVVEEVFAQ